MSKTETQSEALRLADEFEIRKSYESPPLARDLARAAVVLRRLGAENKALRADVERYRPGAFVNSARIKASDCPGSVVRKLDAAFYELMAAAKNGGAA